MTPLDDPTTPPTRTTQYIQWAVGLCVCLAALIVILAIFRPENTTTGPQLLQVFMPIVAGLIAAAVQGIHTIVNSNFAEAKAGRAAAEVAMTTAEAALKVQQEANLVLKRQIDARNSADALAKSAVPPT